MRQLESSLQLVRAKSLFVLISTAYQVFAEDFEADGKLIDFDLENL